MRQVQFQFDGAIPNLSQKWTVDQDSLLQLISNSTSFSVSDDPNVDNNNVYTPGQLSIAETLRLGSNETFIGIPLSIPLSAGRDIYVNGAGAGVVNLFLD